MQAHGADAPGTQVAPPDVEDAALVVPPDEQPPASDTSESATSQDRSMTLRASTRARAA
jgi:hypothetical protein